MRLSWAPLLLLPLLAACNGSDGRSFDEVKAAVVAIDHGCHAKEQPANGVTRSFRLVSCGDFAEGPVGYRWPSAKAYDNERFALRGTLGGKFFVEGSNWLIVAPNHGDAAIAGKRLNAKVHSGSDYH